ncbi:hypothetical protein [Methylobacterium nigriterrae]|uniref:hypothetical protein n=1 Tax=Methylobacterium nigriterrae TaxID=3127512 RepID=UPI003D665C8E
MRSKAFMLVRRTVLAGAATLVAAHASGLAGAADADPLPSWNEGSTKHATLDFVDRVTREGQPGYLSPAERIAVFDNDGTLWAEQPAYFQAAFALDEAVRRGSVIVDMARDWKSIFAAALPSKR